MDKKQKDPHIKIFGFKLTPYIGVGKTLFLWFLIISVLPLVTVSYFNYLNAFRGLTIVAEKTLVSSSKLRADNLNAYFKNIDNDLSLLTAMEENKALLENLHNGLASSGMEVSAFVRSPAWQQLTDKTGFLKRFRTIGNYHDIILVDVSGNVLFSIQKQALFGNNIYDGTNVHTKLAKAIRKSIDNQTKVFSDLEKVSTAGASYISGLFVAPVFNASGNLIGALGLEIENSAIEKAIDNGESVGTSGVSYIIGEDLALRTVPSKDTTLEILQTRMNHKKALEWLNTYDYQPSEVDALEVGKREIISVYQGIHQKWVYGIVRNIKSLEDFGVHWAVIEELEHEEAFAYTRQLAKTVMVSVLITFIIVVIISVFVTRRTVNPIKKLSAWAKEVAEGHLIEKNIRAPKDEVGEMKDTFNNLVSYIRSVSEVTQRIAKGDYSQKVKIRSKEDVLALSVNQMIDSFRSVVEQANTIATGDYSASVRPRSEMDTLGIALENMTRQLRESSQKIREEAWLKTGIGELNARMSGKKDIHELSREVIDYLAEYLNAQVGLLYVKEADVFKFRAGYALEPHGKMKAYKKGEGFVGQAAAAGKRIEIEFHDQKNVPVVDLAATQVTPVAYMAAPFIYENETIGIVELGKIKPFTHQEKQLFDMMMDSVAVAMNAAIAHGQLQKLLSKSQEQQEKLEVQQEELRQTNEELEEQTKALKISENTLQQQKEELSVINEELEERTKALEKEKEKIKDKNKELENARKQIEEKARDLEKASRYKSEFLANMSHELRTPLNSILVLSQLLMRNDQKNLTDKQVEFARTINASGNDLLELINDILDLSKVEAGKLQLNIEKIDITALVTNVQRIFEPVAQRKELELRINVEEEVPRYVESDSQRIMQIIKNLMSNAIKFTEKGYVALRLFVPDNTNSIQDAALKYQKLIGISVSDSGIGISQEKKELIFEAFQQADGTTSRKYGGTGLGLSITKSFTQLLQGEIQMESEEGKGSVFTLFIPVSLTNKEGTKQSSKQPSDSEKSMENKPSENKPSETEIQPAFEDDRDHIREGEPFILIIEDDPIFSRLLYEIIKSKEYKAMIAPDGETGLHYADYYKPAAIVLDVEMPKMDGWEVISRLKNNIATRHIPVHFISGTDNSMRAMKMGAIGFMQKPLSREKAEKVIDKIIHYLERKVKKILVIDDEAIVRKNIEGLLGKKDIQIVSVERGRDAFDLLKEELFDLIILDLGLLDISGFDLLEMMKKEERIKEIPVIVYTGQDLSQEEEQELMRQAESIIIKGARSPERLLAETTLFLHKNEQELPNEKRELLKNAIHQKSDVLKDKMILAVDDDMRNLFALSSVLESQGMKVIMARNGKEAIDKLEQNPDIDLILMDIMMPEMDGYEAMRRIRKMSRFEEIPMIALTAKAMKSDREKSLAAGANEYLSKPIDNKKLISVLKVWLYDND